MRDTIRAAFLCLAGILAVEGQKIATNIETKTFGKAEYHTVREFGST
jgi:hypothetical protein